MAETTSAWEPTARDVPSDAPGAAVSELSSAERAASEEIAEITKIESLKQSQADMTAAFGEPIDEGDKVRWSIDMSDPKNRALYREMTTPWRNALKERSGRYNGRRKVELVDRTTGERRLVFEELEDKVGRQTGMIRRQLGGCDIERGPDGMLFRLVSRDWMPTGRTCLGTPVNPDDDGFAHGVQRDPNGVEWVETELGWERARDLYARKAG